LHLLGPQGQIVSQSDGIPAGWSRPTTGWVAGEYIIDEHTLAIPPDGPVGAYTLVTGLYDPGSGTRLIGPDGTDAVALTTMIVEAR
jgi:hypothetical protein